MAVIGIEREYFVRIPLVGNVRVWRRFIPVEEVTLPLRTVSSSSGDEDEDQTFDCD